MLPPTLLSSPALLAELAPTGIFTERKGRTVGYVALLNGVRLSRNADSSHRRAWARLVDAGGVKHEDVEHLPDYL